MIYGTPSYRTHHDSTDRVGIRTLVISMVWQATGTNLTEALITAQTPGYPPVSAGMYFIGRQTIQEQGRMRTLWTFEGINGDGKNVTFKVRGLSNDYGFDGSFSEVSLLKNKHWFQLRDNFGLQQLDGQITWQDTVPGAATGSGLSGGNKNTGLPNPIFGEDTFFRMEGTYWYRYVSLSPPNTSGVGFIAGALPGNPLIIGNGRNWLMAPPKATHRGPVWDITEIFWLSGEKGWPVQIYTPGGAGSGAGGGTGLETGGLETGNLGPSNLVYDLPPLGGGGTAGAPSSSFIPGLDEATQAAPQPAPGAPGFGGSLGSLANSVLQGINTPFF